MNEDAKMAWLNDVRFDDSGLVAAIAQDHRSGRVLMVAWMNREALRETVLSGHAVYWSRSRQKLWHKGESSGHTQIVKHIWLDCDGDAIVLRVEQVGQIACHTGRESCFFSELVEIDGTMQWQVFDPVLKDPSTIYPTARDK
jgi:phosphoribosyl-AMP cyclohydrolase